jgi:hypothetical protein
MSIIDLFPYPKSLTESGGDIDVTGRSLDVVVPDDAGEVIANARSFLLAAWGDGAGAPYRISIEIAPLDVTADGPGREEAYTLDLTTNGGTIRAEHERGAFLAAQTIGTILKHNTGTIPAVQITDWPDLAWRGLYVESKWGPDLMTLDDWKALIDEMASKKLNSLGVGVYGCWSAQYAKKRTEFLMLPFPEYPDLVTEKTIRYYSPKADAWQTLTYVPKMVEHDFFGEVVAYGKSHNVFVRPHFNGPGHNSVLPRYFPEMASLDENGNPKGYGYCLTNDATYTRLFELFDSVIDRYLAPNGVNWFHMGLDEVWLTPGIDESDIPKLVDPWCQCENCRDRDKGELLQDYAVRVCSHLKSKGIENITLWDDELRRKDALTEQFGKKLADAGLSGNVVVQWWRYGSPVLMPTPEIGVRAWSTPMTGYWSNLFTQSYTSNIWDLVTHGVQHGIEGADSYCIYDLAFDRNYALLANITWNTDDRETLFGFKARYAKATLGRALGNIEASTAFANYEEAFGSPGFGTNTLGWLLYYWHTYPAARAKSTYPQNVVETLRTAEPRFVSSIRVAASFAEEARALFAKANAAAPSPLLAEYEAETNKLVGVWNAYTSILAAATALDAGDRTGATTSLADAREQLVAVMAKLEVTKAQALLPQILRDMSILLRYVERLGEDIQALDSESRIAFAELPVNSLDLDIEVSTAFEQPVDVPALV